MEKEILLDKCTKLCFSCMGKLVESNGKCQKCGYDNRLRTTDRGIYLGLY